MGIELIGWAGSAVVIAAYWPRIYHLYVEKCAGVNHLAALVGLQLITAQLRHHSRRPAFNLRPTNQRHRRHHHHRPGPESQYGVPGQSSQGQNTDGRKIKKQVDPGCLVGELRKRGGRPEERQASLC